MAKHLVWDTETIDTWNNTVLSLDKLPEIFEFYGLTLDTETFEVENDLHLFFKPKKPISKGASRATKRTDADFVNYPPMSLDGITKIKEYIESHDAVVAHRLLFDIEMINFEAARFDLVINWPEMICTLEKTEWLESRWMSLTDLHTLLFGEAFSDAHEAKADVQALTKVYIELLKRNWI